MTIHKRELTPAQVRAVAQVLGVEADSRVWCLAIDVESGEGAADVLLPDDTCLFTGEKMYLDSYAKYPGTGTIQMTVKKQP